MCSGTRVKVADIGASYRNEFYNKLSLARDYAILHHECMVVVDGAEVPRFTGPAFEVYQQQMKIIEWCIENHEIYASPRFKEVLIAFDRITAKEVKTQ